MKYFDVKAKLAQMKVFSVDDLQLINPGFRKETLYEWESRGWVVKLRNQRYIFADYRPTNNDLYMVANRIYEPSYISLEMALNHYGVVPETVLRITSITTNKTYSFETPIGGFDYRSVDKSLFFGYQMLNIGGIIFKIASIYKAISDYLYLNPDMKTVDDFEGLRWNKEVLLKLNWDELQTTVERFDNLAMLTRLSVLEKYIKS